MKSFEERLDESYVLMEIEGGREGRGKGGRVGVA